jgi:hypothetical protein
MSYPEIVGRMADGLSEAAGGVAQRVQALRCPPNLTSYHCQPDSGALAYPGSKFHDPSTLKERITARTRSLTGGLR